MIIMRVFLAAFFVVTWSCVFGQMQASTVESLETIGKIKTSVFLEKNADNQYFVRYQDMRFPSIVEFNSFWFRDIDNALDGFYNLVMDGFGDVDFPPDDLKLEFPDDVVFVRFEKFTGVKMASFVVYDNVSSFEKGRSGLFTKKQIQKLFGRK